MRSRLELILRAVVLGGLAGLLAGFFTAPGESPRDVTAGTDVGSALREATRSGAGGLTARLESAPDPVERDWLAALRSAGVAVAWDASRVSPVALGAAAISEPAGGVRVTASATGRAEVILADSLGVIDTLRVRGGAGSIRVRTTAGRLTATSTGTSAFVESPSPIVLKRVLLLGPAGWESKFTVMALEEAGWDVDARLDVAPGVSASQGGAAVPDTARHSAVIALDGTAAGAASGVARFVAQGGGAILVGSATRLPSVASISPGIAGPRMAGRPRAEGSARESAAVVHELPAARLVNLRPDAGSIVARGAAPLVAARRAGRGRVLAAGLDETWRWRMRSDSGARVAHSEWWSSMVGAVARTGPAAPKPSAPMNPAPRAALTMALGVDAGGFTAASGGRGWQWLEVFLFGAFLASILGEVYSRRKRGLA